MVTTENGKMARGNGKGGVGKFHRATPSRTYFFDKHLGKRSEHVGHIIQGPPLRTCFCINTLVKHLNMLGKFYRAPTWAVQFWGGPKGNTQGRRCRQGAAFGRLGPPKLLTRD